MRNILLLQGSGVYDAQRNYIDELAKGLRKFGYNTIVLDYEKCNPIERFNWIMATYPLYAILWTNQILDNEVLQQIKSSSVPCVDYYCDHPMYHAGMLNKSENNWIVLFLDRKHLKYLNKYFPQFRTTGFLPLAGQAIAANWIRPYDMRKIDVLFTGSYRPAKQIPPQPKTENYIEYIHWAVWNKLLESPHLTLDESLEWVFTQQGVAVSGQEFHEIVIELKYIEQEVRAYYRERMICSLLASGIQVHVFGNGWESLECEGKENLTIRKGNSKAALRALGDTKIALNIMPWFKEGLQERIVSGMLCGAVSVTDPSAYIEEEFSDGENIILYHLEDIEEIADKVHWLLNHEKEAAAIAKAGQICASQKHTWENRAVLIAELIEQVHHNHLIDTNKPGEELPIALENECFSYYLRDVEISFRKNIQYLYDFWLNGYLAKGDIYKFFKKFRIWNENIEKKLGSGLINKSNLEISYKNILMIYQAAAHKNEIMEILFILLQQVLKEIQSMVRSLELENLFLEEHKDWNRNLYDEILLKMMKQKYQHSSEPGIAQWNASMQHSKVIDSYPASLQKPHAEDIYDIRNDASHNLYYVMHHGKRMYYPAEYSLQMVYTAYRFMNIEQDAQSPHCYLDEQFNVDEGSVVIDAGAAEGNFSLDIVEKARKIYLVECDEKWFLPLELTFAPWHDKVIIIHKMLGNQIDDITTTIDEIVGDDIVDFIKMDVEGAEADALLGAENTLARNYNIKCAIATYHKKGMEERVKQYLQKQQFEVSNKEGYLLFRDYSIPVWENELRHALVRAEKTQA